MKICKKCKEEFEILLQDGLCTTCCYHKSMLDGKKKLKWKKETISQEEFDKLVKFEEEEKPMKIKELFKNTI